MKTSTLFAALSAAAIDALHGCRRGSAGTGRAAGRRSAGARHAVVARRLHRVCPGTTTSAYSNSALQVEQTDVELVDLQIQPAARPERIGRSYNATVRARHLSSDNTPQGREPSRPRARSTSGPACPVFDGIPHQPRNQGRQARPRRRHAGFGTRTRRPVNQRHDAVPGGSLQQGARPTMAERQLALSTLQAIRRAANWSPPANSRNRPGTKARRFRPKTS